MVWFLVALLATPTIAVAAMAPAAIVDTGPGRVEVDWTAGELRATGAAAADLRWPTRDVARVVAERHAGERAAKLLAAAALRLPVASGGTVADLVGRDAAARSRLDALLAAHHPRRIHYASDGGTEVTFTLGLHAVACALVPQAATVSAAAPFVVDARRVAKLRPALGLALRAGTATHRGPVRYVRETAAKPQATARATDGGHLDVDVLPAGPAPILVILKDVP